MFMKFGLNLSHGLVYARRMSKKIFIVGAGALSLVMFAVSAYGARLQFDTAGRFLMQDKPRFLLGVYDAGLPYSTDPLLYEKQIFSSDGARKLGDIPLNIYLNYHYGGLPIAAANALMDTLQKHGMMYLHTANCFDDGSWTRYGPGSFSAMDSLFRTEFAKHPAAAGYYIMDECADALHDETKAHNAEIHASDSQAKTLATLLAASYRTISLWNDTADILAIDPYPMYGPEPAGGYNHYKVADYIARLRTFGPQNRPIMAVLQFFKFTTDSRMPTYAEMRTHAVMSAVEGAQGIFWWALGPGGLHKLGASEIDQGMANLKKLTTELSRLEPALLAPARTDLLVGNSAATGDALAYRIKALEHNMKVNTRYSDTEADRAERDALLKGDTSKSYLLNQSGPIRTRVSMVDGKGYLLAYNYTDATVPVTFTWRNAISKITVSEEARTITSDGAKFSDSFGPYAAHVYVVEESGGTTPPPSYGYQYQTPTTPPSAPPPTPPSYSYQTPTTPPPAYTYQTPTVPPSYGYQYQTPTTPTSSPPVSATKFQIGDRVLVTARRLRVRFTPAGRRIGFQRLNAEGSVIDGPVSRSGYVWWKINFDSGPDGWSAEPWLKKVISILSQLLH
jgi:hypothetical protein